MLVPIEDVTPTGDLDVAEAGRWVALGKLLVPDGGLRAWEAAVVNGTTGGFGSAEVAVAPRIGAARLVATGRNGRACGPGPPPRPASAAHPDDRRRGRRPCLNGKLADGPVDCVFNLLPHMESVSRVRVPVVALRPGGSAVLMGVRRSGGADLGLPYKWLMRNDITVRPASGYTRATPRGPDGADGSRRADRPGEVRRDRVRS
jgi:alcohol dehydrogenase